MNIHEPVFVIGAPKTGSTALHVAFSNSQLFNYPDLKDTKMLGSNAFSLEMYEKHFFPNDNRRIFEADQNLAINHHAFKNIATNFVSPSVVYVLREPEKRFFSAFSWLKKNGMCNSINDALKLHWNWMIEHGLYVKNLQANILPTLPQEAHIYLVSFERLFSADDEVYSDLCDALNIDKSKMPNLKVVNQSLKPRNATVVNFLRSMFAQTRTHLPKRVTELVKKSSTVESLLYSKTKIDISPREKAVYSEYSSHFAESQELWEEVTALGIKDGWK